MNQGLYILLLVIQGVAWGAQFSMLKLTISGGYHEVTVLFIALVLIALGYLLILVVRRSVFSLTRDSLTFFVITGVLGYVVPLLAAIYSAYHLSAGIMALIACLTPLVTIAVAGLLGTETVSWRRGVAVGLGLVAATLVLAPEIRLPGHGSLKWLLLVCLVPLCYGIESIYVSARWPASLDAWQVGFGEAAVAAVLVFPLFLVFGNSTPVLRWTSAEWGILFFVLSGLVEVVLYFYIIQKTGGVLVSFSYFISLFAGVGWGILLFDESHGASILWAIGILVIALGLFSVDTLQREREKSV